jgi:membrane protease YdiL (CAAX protease family)
MEPEPDRQLFQTQATERGAALALLPIAATLTHHILPAALQELTLVQLTPQLLAYLALALWASHNPDVLSRLGMEHRKIPDALRWGLLTGMFLGILNTFVILSAYPRQGYDISFLKTTPHAQFPPLVMVPWFICSIALFVELNFRGFLLGRLATLESRLWSSGLCQRLSPLALITSALIFTFDPFLVNTFRYLHWIALWNGLIWGAIWLRTRNLYITIVGHSVEVIVMYSVVRTVLG